MLHEWGEDDRVYVFGGKEITRMPKTQVGGFGEEGFTELIWLRIRKSRELLNAQ
jgi:hypothetical protein